MGLLSKCVRRIARGMRPAVSGESVRHASEVVEDCCRQLGWSIDERIDAREVRLHFKDPVIGIRRVIVTVSEDDRAMSITTFSSAGCIRARQLPGAVLAYLVERNSKMIVSWQMFLRIDGQAMLALNYYTHASGMNPAVFRNTCETMVQEAQAVDAKLTEIRAASLAHLLQYNGPHFGEKP